MRTRQVASVASVVIALLTSCTSICWGQQPPPPTREWTVMVYMNADTTDLEDDALENFKQMAEGLTADAPINLVLLFDRHANDTTTGFGDWSDTRAFVMRPGLTPLPANADPRYTAQERDMGHPDTLRDFMIWSMRTFPAQRFALILWGHGNGFRYRYNEGPEQTVTVFVDDNGNVARTNNGQGKQLTLHTQLVETIETASQTNDSAYRSVSPDATSGTRMYTAQLQQAVREAIDAVTPAGQPPHSGRLDLIGFDSCLMANLETAYALRETSKIFVASEELEPGWGWNYRSIMSAMSVSRGLDEVALGRLLVKLFQEEMDSQEDYTYTLSAVKLERIGQLAADVSQLSLWLQGVLAQHPIPIEAARKGCKPYNHRKRPVMIDVKRYLEMLQTSLAGEQIASPAPIAQILGYWSDVVIARYAGSGREGKWGSHGLSIYYPESTRRLLDDPDHPAYRQANTDNPVPFVVEQTWDEFMHSYLQGR